MTTKINLNSDRPCFIVGLIPIELDCSDILQCWVGIQPHQSTISLLQNTISTHSVCLDSYFLGDPSFVLGHDRES